MASVKVALRVRPFDSREKALSSKCIVEIDSKITRLLSSSSKDSSEIKEFTFDNCYWSHDKEDSNFASQESVYNDLGATVVENVLQGYNACVFAYGQTGSGKTYTMMGNKEDLGLIPRICEALFKNVDEGRKSGATYRVEANYLEIYNEKVKDLLSSSQSNKNPKLKVREDKLTGPFVENLSKHQVNTFGEINRLMGLGNNCRTTASTKMNDTSSRSHAIFTITFTQARIENDLPQETISKIHLVDLAGSERASSTGASGVRLNEGSHINKSLVTLGQVIQGLADCSSKKLSSHIPYRDSTLTWLLKDSLGGNSKTIMIATISPAEVNYMETLGTLRYASRAKSIINKPKVNEDPHVRQIKTLKEEINRLKSEIESQKKTSENCFADEGILEELNSKQAQKNELTTMWTEKWKQTRKILQEQKALGLKKTGESGLGVTLYSDQPHVVVMGSKSYSGGATVFTLQGGVNSVGSAEGQDIMIEGVEILDSHCTIERNNEGTFLEPKAGAPIYFGNEAIEERINLRHGFMLLLGDNTVLKYNDPEEAHLVKDLEKKDRFFNKSLRNSFLSRSNLDLYKSTDDISLREKEMQDASNLNLKKGYVTNLCEMATQTSINLESSNTPTPIADGCSRDPKSCMSLALKSKTESQESPSMELSSHSTPASDTFYTATSILSPDSSEILSPLPNDETSPSTDPMNSTPENGQIAPVHFQDLITSPIYPVSHPPPIKNVASPIREDQPVSSSESSNLLPANKKHGASNISPPSRYHSNSLNKFHEKSNLISFGDDINHTLDVAKRLESHCSDKSFKEQQRELKKLKDTYSKLEDQMLKEGVENKENLDKRPTKLTLDQQFLNEGRVALLIEREVNRRVLERFSSLETEMSHRRRNTDASITSLPDRMVASYSPDSSNRNFNPHLQPIRPHSSMSANNYNIISRGTLDSPMEENATPMTGSSEFDKSCGFCVTIPGFQLRGTGSLAHWEYEVRLVAGDDSWTIYRRYRRFRELHMYMCHKYGSPIEDLYFPPRRIFGNNSERVIEERRVQLQVYLQQLFVLCSEMEGSPLCDVAPNRSILISFSPFFERGVFEAGRDATS